MVELERGSSVSDCYTSSQTLSGERGFTLVELSIVVAIVAVLVGGTLMLGGARLDQQRVNSTKERLDLIERALKNYAEVNGRLPCPADSRLTRSSTDYGKASGPNGDCTTGTVKAPRSSGEVVSGAVPFIELALPADLMFDNWGRKFTYVVDRRYTSTNAAKMNAQNSKCGSIVVADASDVAITSNAMFVLISHGRDGHGAYHNATGAPWQLNAQIVHTAALDNAGLDTNFNDDFDNRFRMMGYYEDATDAKNTFDDIMLYRNRSDWRLSSDAVFDNYTLNNIPTRPGWVYVSEYTLPSGKVVPGFEVMKYLASDPEGDGVPRSVPGEYPWSSITFTNARKACQKLGYSAANAATGDGERMEYDIISETQWLSIAHQAVVDSRNWVGECFGKDYVAAGHRDGSPNDAIAASADDADGYYLTGNSAADATAQNRAQRRTLYLPSGGVLWDMSGNRNQWSYCDLVYAENENVYRLNKYGDGTAYSLCRGNGTTDIATFTDTYIANTSWYDFNVPSGIETSTRNGKFIDLVPPYGFGNNNFLGGLRSPDTAAVGGVTRGSAHNAINWTGIFRVLAGYEVGTATPFARSFRCVRNFGHAKFNPRNLANLDIWYDASDLDGDFSEEWDDASITESGRQTSTAPCNATTNICVSVWRNKASNDNYHARSKYLNGAGSGNESNMPTIKLNAINGRPAVNFSSTTEQWFDTHHGVSSGVDTGAGYNFNGKGEFSIFVVANASSYDAIVAATDNTPTWWPFFVLFPYNIGNHLTNDDYVFLTQLAMAGGDAGNTFCQLAQGIAPTSCLPHATNKTNFACAKMGGIDTITNGLTHGSTHIATGIFQKNVANGLAAYVDGAAADKQNSAVQTQNSNINGATCGGASEPVNLMLAIGRNRNDANIRTKGDVAEIIIYNRALSNKERVAVERYLADKYGITYRGPGSETEE